MRTTINIAITSYEPDYPLHAIADLLEDTIEELRNKAKTYDTNIPPAFGNLHLRSVDNTGYVYALGNYSVYKDEDVERSEDL